VSADLCFGQWLLVTMVTDHCDEVTTLIPEPSNNDFRVLAIQSVRLDKFVAR